MEDRVRRSGRLPVYFVALALSAWGCHVTPAHPAPPLSTSVDAAGPCCEREQIYDLYAAPYRQPTPR
jgi:hypothetical protein